MVLISRFSPDISHSQMAMEICLCLKCGCGSSTVQFVKPDPLLVPVLNELSTGRMPNDWETRALQRDDDAIGRDSAN